MTALSSGATLVVVAPAKRRKGPRTRVCHQTVKRDKVTDFFG